MRGVTPHSKVARTSVLKICVFENTDTRLAAIWCIVLFLLAPQVRNVSNRRWSASGTGGQRTLIHAALARAEQNATFSSCRAARYLLPSRRFRSRCSLHRRLLTLNAFGVPFVSPLLPSCFPVFPIKMEKEKMSIRALAQRAGVSPTVIQKIRSKDAERINFKTFTNVLHSLGYTIRFERMQG